MGIFDVCAGFYVGQETDADDYMRLMAMRAQPGLLLICTMYFIYIYVYM